MKIGYTDNLKNRMRAYKCCNPNFELLCISEGCYQDENRWQKKYGNINDTEWGIYNEQICQEFYKQAYLTDIIYFDCPQEILDKALLNEDPLGSYILSYEDNKYKIPFTKIAMASGKIPRIKIVEDKVVYVPTTGNSNILYVRDIISKLKHKPVLRIEDIDLDNIKDITKSNPTKGLSWVINKLIELNKFEFTYLELEEIFKPLFKEHDLYWNKNTTIKNYFPEFIKKQKTIKSKRDTYYMFKI